MVELDWTVPHDSTLSRRQNAGNIAKGVTAGAQAIRTRGKRHAT